MCSADFLLYLLAILFPPLPVWVKVGICSADSVINILLCMLGFLPGLIHAWYIISIYPDPYMEPNHSHAEEGNVTYYYVAHRMPAPPTTPAQQHQQQQQQRSYGTTNNASRPAEEGSSVQGPGVPPSYEQAVRGDHKVQSSN